MGLFAKTISPKRQRKRSEVKIRAAYLIKVATILKIKSKIVDLSKLQKNIPFITQKNEHISHFHKVGTVG